MLKMMCYHKGVLMTIKQHVCKLLLKHEFVTEQNQINNVSLISCFTELIKISYFFTHIYICLKQLLNLKTSPFHKEFLV